MCTEHRQSPVHTAPTTDSRSGSAVLAKVETDRQLLERFIRYRDHLAFRTLVERYGPMIIGVCQRILGDIQEAEDAFQATFLVLVRKAHALRCPELLGN